MSKIKAASFRIAYVTTIFFYGCLFGWFNMICFDQFSKVLESGPTVIASACVLVVSSYIFAEIIVNQLSKELLEKNCKDS